MAFTAPPAEKTEMMERAAVRGRSLWDDARTRLLRNKAAVASLVVLGILTFLAFIGPLLWVHGNHAGRGFVQKIVSDSCRRALHRVPVRAI